MRYETTYYIISLEKRIVFNVVLMIKIIIVISTTFDNTIPAHSEYPGHTLLNILNKTKGMSMGRTIGNASK